jgi:hypothetical protein
MKRVLGLLALAACADRAPVDACALERLEPVARAAADGERVRLGPIGDSYCSAEWEIERLALDDGPWILARGVAGAHDAELFGPGGRHANLPELPAWINEHGSFAAQDMDGDGVLDVIADDVEISGGPNQAYFLWFRRGDRFVEAPELRGQHNPRFDPERRALTTAHLPVPGASDVTRWERRGDRFVPVETIHER